ncbi:MAG: hypothetical protein EOP45_05865 [Sphingobacteriaceae bacterium]|nr:MAG: hypothetical protein EOP45_05865 [Sphingobacteriaceae bacterium]
MCPVTKGQQKCTNKITESDLEQPTKKAKLEPEVKFTETCDGKAALNSLVYHESRPNVSINVCKTGYVRLPDEAKAKELGIDVDYPTQQYRSYMIIQNGIVKTRKLPVSLDKRSFTKLIELVPSAFDQMNPRYAKGRIYIIDFSNVSSPVYLTNLTFPDFSKRLK